MERRIPYPKLSRRLMEQKYQKIQNKNNLKSMILKAALNHHEETQMQNKLELDIEESELSEHELEVLFSIDFPNLKKIRFINQHIGNNGLGIVLRKKGIHLTQLDLRQCRITSIGLKHLVPNQLVNLKVFISFFNSIGSDGCKNLSKAHLPNLQELKLIHCNIGNEGAKNLSKSKWSKLKSITISDRNMKSYGFEIIHELHWTSLYNLFQYGSDQPITKLHYVCLENKFVFPKLNSQQVIFREVNKIVSEKFGLPYRH